MINALSLTFVVMGGVLMGVGCAGDSIQPPTTGSLAVTATTSGPSPDPDGYTITLDGTDRGALPASGATTLEGLTPVSHTVGLSGVATNCQVEGANPRAATVPAGASTTVAFAITCSTPAPVTGTLRITTSTTGPDPDPNGYAVAVDGGTSQSIGVNATATLANVAAGAHTVRLSDIGANCSVQGASSRSVTVSGGAIADVSFSVTCAAATGGLEITTSTTGNAPDPDGYTVAVDDAVPQGIGVTASRTVLALSPGTHRVTLGGLATNCRLEGDNPRSVTITVGATATVAFRLNCPMARIAFISFRDGNGEVYVMNADGSGQTNLTNNAGNDFLDVSSSDDVWSPDGSRILFVSDRDAGDFEIYVMNADGTGQARLTNNPGFDFDPLWSPDGTKIVFHRVSPNTPNSEGDIYVMNSDGSGQTNLTRNPASDAYPVWSPDGSKVVFESSRDGNQEIYVMNADGGGQTNLTQNPSDDVRPDWSPDGGKITFHSYSRDGNLEIYVMNADGSAQTNLSLNIEGDRSPAWSPDGRKIAFERASDIYVMNADGSGQARLTKNRDGYFNPRWSPDGRKIAFDGQGNQGDVFVMNPDGTGLRNLTGRPESDSRPAWSP